MATYRSPGIYVTEISSLPPSVAGVATAVPVFIGHTQLGPAASEEPKVERISTLQNYEFVFGGPQPSRYTINARQNPSSSLWDLSVAEGSTEAEFLMYYSLSLYFQNGGGSCYVISVGNYSDDAAVKDRYTVGLNTLATEDEPTLIVFPDAANVLAAIDYYTLCQESLAQCSDLGDRFAILDVPGGSTAADERVAEFRNGLSTNALRYGAAYHPYLQTAQSFNYDDDDVTIKSSSSPPTAPANDGEETDDNEAGNPAANQDTETLADIRLSQSALYNQIKTLLRDRRVTLPPSAAIAGVYARVDRQRGVWKAPANESVLGIIGPAVKISHQEQKSLNIDAVAGKSINAIRAFTGKGTLVWGARTLAGNDNEWRYVPVRRLCNMIEESTRKSTAFTVFEPNDINTWVKVQAMIEHFLQGLWRSGALTGTKPEHAYFVNIGLGHTMTAQDLLEGRMNVEIGVAPVKPAEFIVLKFSHKLKEV